MKKSLVLLVLSVALVLGVVPFATAADVSSQATLGSNVVDSSSPYSVEFNVKANVLPKAILTVPDYVNFGDVYPEDTGSKAYTVSVKSNQGYTVARGTIPANDLGVAITGALDSAQVETSGGDRTYGETASINVAWTANGAVDVPVLYTVVIP